MPTLGATTIFRTLDDCRGARREALNRAVDLAKSTIAQGFRSGETRGQASTTTRRPRRERPRRWGAEWRSREAVDIPAAQNGVAAALFPTYDARA